MRFLHFGVDFFEAPGYPQFMKIYTVVLEGESPGTSFATQGEAEKWARAVPWTHGAKSGRFVVHESECHVTADTLLRASGLAKLSRAEKIALGLLQEPGTDFPLV